jgi:SAM-dependent methyltransferase
MQHELSIGPTDPLAREGNLLGLPFQSESFDRITCSGVLSHVVDLEPALEELARVLRVGGRMVIEEENALSVHALGWEPLVRAIKRVLGVPLSARSRTQRGIEEWIDGGAGSGVLNRKLDPRFLERFLAARGLVLVARSALDLAPEEADHPLLGKIVRRANRWYVELEGPPALAARNEFVFEKRWAPLDARDQGQNASQSNATSTSARFSS